MSPEYSALSGIRADEFKQRMSACFDKNKATKSDSDDIKKIEDFLDLKRDALKHEEFYVSDGTCGKCSRKFTFYDHVIGSVTDAGHSKSLVVHTLFGSKHFIQPPRPVRCSACNTISVDVLTYETSAYGCCS